MPEITLKDLNNLKKKMIALQNEFNVLEEKIVGGSSSGSYEQMIFSGVLDGKNTTQSIREKGSGVTPYNTAANNLLKQGFLKTIDPTKKRITGKISFDINFQKLLDCVFKEYQSQGTTLLIENYYLWIEKKLRFDKEFCDKILKFMRNRHYISLKGGDPIEYSGRYYCDEKGVKYYYVVKREDKSTFNN